MTNVTAKQIAEFRAKTGLPMMECKKALIEANGDEEKALELLRKKGITKAAQKSERTTKAGIVESYIHNGGQIGVLVEVLSETDFVAKNEEFKSFVHDLALHIAGANPKYISKEEIPLEEIEKERKILEEQVAADKKPAEIVEKIINGKLEKYYSEICLLNQSFIKDQEITIADLLASKIQKIGENIIISRFARFEIGR
ncbi:MAG: elongation factor Ts [Patescibacteria group bacterium]|nr:elongation factor Ts [Patescibacteria group bacterium]